MKKVALLIPENCYAPEIFALKKYLDCNTKEKISSNLISMDEFLKDQDKYDIAYRMMGFSPLFFNSIKIPEIHDYASLSTGKFISIKNALKRNFQKKPIFRTFLNENLFNEFCFNDNIPFGFSDMAVNECFFDSYKFDYNNKEFDFCYVGEISKERNLDEMISFFENSNFNVLFVGENKLDNFNYKNIKFTGKVDNSSVPFFIDKCRFAINFVPDVYPYNLQTSTKLLEYIATGIPIVSNKYKWVDDYIKNKNISLYYFDDFNFLKDDLLELYNKFENTKNSSQVVRWNEVFESSGLIDFLLNYKVN